MRSTGGLTLLLWSLLLSGCSNDYEIKLPHEYGLVRANEKETFISNQQGFVVVYGKITSYAISGDLVVGEMIKPDWGGPEKTGLEAVLPGYFILDTTTGKAVTGLRKLEWESKLKEMNIAPPSLLPPSCPRNVFGLCSS